MTVLKGLIIRPIKRFHDERGFFTELMRTDWADLFGEDQVAQANFSSTYPGVIRAWHRHLRGQNDYFLVLEGAIEICVYDEKTQELDEIVSSSLEFQAVKVPGRFWHGFKNIGNKPATLRGVLPWRERNSENGGRRSLHGGHQGLRRVLTDCLAAQ